MIRSIFSRLSAMILALAIAVAACSDSNPVAPRSSAGNTALTGVVAIPYDPSILNILVSNCDATILPSGAVVGTPWQQEDGSGSIELAAGCYDIRVIRMTAEGIMSREQRVLISGGDVHFLAV
jgi:hypothetical protein